MSMREIQSTCYSTAKASGWWPEDTDLRVIPEKLALIHSEISEALEEYRNGNMEIYHSTTGKPEGFGVELADAVIRILDLSEFLGLDMEELVQTKDAYNRTREFRHGGKLA